VKKHLLMGGNRLLNETFHHGLKLDEAKSAV
jgi:hypothetical protein